MEVFSSLGGEFEQVLFAHEPECGLRAIIAIYTTAPGPAIGGTRIYPFPSEEAAFRDVLRLAKAMAYKAAAAGLAAGGGKAVVIADPHRDKTPELLRAYGRAVDRLGGAYITTADVGSTVADLDIVAEVTRFVTGTSRASGDPSPVTAHGIWHGMRAVAEEAFGEPSLSGRHVVQQGTGKVGSALARLLVAEGARLTLADVDRAAVEILAKELGAEVIPPDEALSTPCDLLAPCALGPVVTSATIGGFKCRAIAGAANNQLERPEHARALAEAGILYAPDYVINAGGVLSLAGLEKLGWTREQLEERLRAIGATLAEVFAIAEKDGTSTETAAARLVRERLHAARSRA